MTPKIDEGTRLAEPCQFCAGPRVLLARDLQPSEMDHLATFKTVVSATICLRCDGPAPLRVPADASLVEPPKDGSS